MMELSSIRPTRMELLRTKSRIRLARRGLELLKLKRSSLIMEFFKIVRDVKGLRLDLHNDVVKAIKSERLAEIMSSTVLIESLVLLQKPTNVNVGIKNVMGVRIPEVSVKYGETFITKFYENVSLPSSLLETRRQFEKLLEELILIAEKEIAMRKLLLEIDKTKRRTNSIENVLIPRLVSTSNYIKMRLDEMDREMFITLKLIKGKIEERGRALNSVSKFIALYYIIMGINIATFLVAMILIWGWLIGK
jgi:H(+)-transporting ATP synthase, vacuolar type, subunit D